MSGVNRITLKHKLTLLSVVSCFFKALLINNIQISFFVINCVSRET